MNRNDRKMREIFKNALYSGMWKPSKTTNGEGLDQEAIEKLLKRSEGKEVKNET